MTLTSLPKKPSSDIVSGNRLAGDDYSPEQLQLWYQQEENAFSDMDIGSDMTSTDPWYSYMRYLNEKLSKQLLLKRWQCDKRLKVLILGPGNGADAEFLRNLYPEADFSFIEVSIDFQRILSERYGQSSIVMPNFDNAIKLKDESIDLVVAFSVLHHIANVSFVVKEVSRVMRPGGLFITREPCSSMGDWSKPRLATPNERGIAAHLLVEIATQAGLQMSPDLRVTPVLFAPLNKILFKLRKYISISNKTVWLCDKFLSRVVSFNDWYWRDFWWKKIGPSAYFYAFEKTKTRI